MAAVAMKLLEQKSIRAPELDATDWAGEALRLAELRGRVVLLDFFSYGDPEGIRSLPRIRALGDRYREAGLTVVGVHVPAYDFERPLETARQEIWRLGLSHPVALDHDFELFRRYRNRDLPARHVLDTEGFARGWYAGRGGLVETEKAIRHLLEEGGHSPLPPPLPPDELVSSPGDLEWMSSAELRFGTRHAGFGLAPEMRGEGPEEEGATRDFGDLPDVRAESHAYLEGRWTLGQDRIHCHSAEGALAVVFRGSSVHAVISRRRAEIEDPGPDARIDVTLDGELPAGAAAGVDIETQDGATFVRIERGRVYELIASTEFGLHNLDVRVRGRGVCVHLISFGTNVVPGSG